MKKEVIYSLDTFGGRLQDLRIKKGLSRNAFYKALKGKNGEIIPEGYGEKTVRSWESGNAWPSAELIRPMCEILGCDADYLLGGIEHQTHELQELCVLTGLSESAAKALEKGKETKGAIYKADGVMNLLGDAFLIDQILISGELPAIGHDLNLALQAAIQRDEANQEDDLLRNMELRKAAELAGSYGCIVINSEYAVREYVNTACERVRRILLDYFDPEA